MQNNLRERLAKQFEAARARTLQIFELAHEAVLHESPGFGFRPILWHLAHIGAFEEYWLLNKIAGKTTVNKRFQIIFDPIKTPRENSKILPSKAEMLDYLQTVRDGVLRILDKFDFASNNPLSRDGYVFDLVLQHELQHQETLAYLFHLLPLERVQSPKSKVQSLKSAIRNPQSAIEIPGGNFIVGATGNNFVYDNEIPAHERFIPTFTLDRFLATNAEFAEFIAEQGYDRKEFWSEEGWKSRKKENWNAPLYWKKNGNDWQIRTLFEAKSLNDFAELPVYGVSFYEAEAYARFRGKRLPNEFELEKAASLIVPESDFRGVLWQWTESDFAPYPNFEPFPYEDYSQAWFDGDHKVLKGGSFATSKEILRTSFRNFFRRSFRIAFAGIRLASDV